MYVKDHGRAEGLVTARSPSLGIVTQVARKGNLLARHRAHPHHELEGVAVVVWRANVRRSPGESFESLLEKVETDTIVPLLRARRRVGELM